MCVLDVNGSQQLIGNLTRRRRRRRRRQWATLAPDLALRARNRARLVACALAGHHLLLLLLLLLFEPDPYLAGGMTGWTCAKSRPTIRSRALESWGARVGLGSYC